MECDLVLDPDALIPERKRLELGRLPSSIHILGDRVPLTYELEGGVPVVGVRLREGQARRLRRRDIPQLDRPIRFSVQRGRREVARASSIDELRQRVRDLPPDRRRGRRKGRR
jgi:hypothetical protein